MWLAGACLFSLRASRAARLVRVSRGLWLPTPSGASGQVCGSGLSTQASRWWLLLAARGVTAAWLHHPTSYDVHGGQGL